MPALIMLEQWWKLALGVAVGALMCFPLAECHGERVADARNAAALKAANDEIKIANDKAIFNADLIESVAKSERDRTIEELHDAVKNAPNGEKVSQLLDRLRASQK